MNRGKFLAACLSASLLLSFYSFNQPSLSKTRHSHLITKSFTGQVTKNSTYIDSLIDEGKYDTAEQICEKKLGENPANVVARTDLGNIYAAQYKLDGALKEFTEVLKKDPNNAAAHEGLASVYYKETASSNMDIIKNTDNLYKKALNEYNIAIRKAPTDYKAYNGAGKVLQEMGKLNQAESYYRKALDIEPKYSEALENLGTILYAKNQTNAAMEKYKESIALNSKNSSAYYHLGEALISKGEYGKAISSLQTALYLFPNSAPVHNMLGQAYESQGNEAAAIAEYSKSSLIKPEYSAPYLKLANIYQNRGDSEFALTQLKNSVTINPNFSEGKLKIADISLNTGKTDQAISYYKDLLNNKTYKNVALKGLANAYFTQAQELNDKANLVSDAEYQKVENSIRQAIKYNPDDLQLYLALLRVSRLTNKDGQADLYLSKIVDNPSDRPIDHVIKGEALITYGKYTEAQNEFSTALNQVNNPDSIIQLGEIFFLNRQYDSAKQAFNRALSKEPNNLTAHRYLDRIKKSENEAIAKYNIAKAFFDEHQRIAAIEALKDCLLVNPDLADAQLLLAQAFEKEKYYPNAIEHYNIYISLATIDTDKYRKKVEKLTNKVQRMQEQGKPIKKFTRI